MIRQILWIYYFHILFIISNKLCGKLMLIVMVLNVTVYIAEYLKAEKQEGSDNGCF